MDPHRLYMTGIIVMFVGAAITFPLLFRVPAPYGRHRKPGWGPEMNDVLGWIIQEAPSVIVFAWVYFRGEHALELVPLVLLALWQAHYIQRSFVFPFLLRGKKSRRAPLATIGLAFLFTSINGALNAFAISHGPARYGAEWVSDPRFIIGVLLFLIGYSVNRHSDSVLRSLRKPGEDGYKIPHKGLHSYVASPNYFGELIEWIGWALASWSLAGLAFAVFTFANLAPRAHTHLKWYRETFSDYPKERKALIPGVW